MAEKIDISPKVRETIIERSRRALPWKTILGEWIDNSLDANASTIAIEFSKGWLRVQDDGGGTPDPTAMVQLGAHNKHSTTKLGRYGIGAKDAALVAGGERSTVAIETIHGGIKRMLSVAWQLLDSWQIDSPTEEMATPAERGTTIIVSQYAKRAPGPKEFEDLLSDIGYVFARAIKQGKQIKLRRHGGPWTPVLRWEPPLFDGAPIVAEPVSINGKMARVTVGVVREGLNNPRRGFTYFHGWRVIEEASSNGCGEFAMSRVCGFVELDDAWRLTPNKDGLLDNIDREALYAEVERVSRPVLERGNRVATTISSRAFETACSTMLSNALSTVRAKAKRGGKTGKGRAIKPVGSGSPHQQAAIEQPGNTFAGRRTGGEVRMEFGSCASEYSIGEVAGNRVILNERHPLIDRVRREDNALAAVEAAMMLIAAAQVLGEADGQLRIPTVSPGSTTKDFAEIAGRALALMSQPGDRSAAPT